MASQGSAGSLIVGVGCSERHSPHFPFYLIVEKLESVEKQSFAKSSCFRETGKTGWPTYRRNSNFDSPERDDFIAAVDAEIMNGRKRFELSEAAKRVACEIERTPKVLDLRPPIKRHLVFNPGVAFCF